MPVIVMTAHSDLPSAVSAYEGGAFEYLPKPFDLNIFIARLNGLLRRQQWTRERATPEVGGTFEINGKTIDFENLELISDDGVTRLTLMEMKLLRFLIENEGQTVSRKTILEDVWNLQEDTDTRAIDNFIVRLRKYLEDEPNNPKIVRTVRGVGYKFVAGDR